MPLRPFHGGTAFALLLYERRGGASPIADFLARLARRDRTSLTGCEFLEFRPGQQLVFWCYASERRIVLLHGFTKKSNQTPRRELNRGERLRSELRDEIGE